MISHSIRAAMLATVFAVAMSSAGPSAHAASFDGPWSVLAVTRSGACDQAYRYGVTIVGGVVYYAGGGPVSLTISHFPPPPSIKIDTGVSAPPPPRSPAPRTVPE